LRIPLATFYRFDRFQMRYSLRFLLVIEVFLLILLVARARRMHELSQKSACSARKTGVNKTSIAKRSTALVKIGIRDRIKELSHIGDWK